MYTVGIWDKLHKHYIKQDWIDKPNIFAKEALEYFPPKARILCLGDGQGQDSRFFATKGYTVLSTDISKVALDINNKKIKKAGLLNISTQELDLNKGFSLSKDSFDVVYAHLSLHYFTEEKTKQIFHEITRVLKTGGILAIIVNSINDPEFNTGTRIEQELFKIQKITKRFFSKYSLMYFAKDFQCILLDDNGRTYKDEKKGVQHLVRFVGRKVS